MEYVSFQEAIKASIEGKTVYSWLDDESKPYNDHCQKYDELSKGIRIDKFVLMGDELTRFDELKWTIKSD
ncbi:hypothetical protein QTG56_24100 (plasmid) [Rossellomorea sp. AcN35-11]|nr:hypothetical protein [Rossellomorea aquimaris]WJV31722.1 hypothetical protein QTG56_24100 [Rossellomorea sp. AcN35-11]